MTKWRKVKKELKKKELKKFLGKIVLTKFKKGTCYYSEIINVKIKITTDKKNISYKLVTKPVPQLPPNKEPISLYSEYGIIADANLPIEYIYSQNIEPNI